MDENTSLSQKDLKDLIMRFLSRTLRQGNVETTQQELLVKLFEEEGIEIEQSTISRYLKELGYEKRGKRYVKTIKKNITEVSSILARVLAYANTTFKLVHSQDMSTLYIFTRVRLEHSIAELISLRFEKGILGIFPGQGCVTIYLESEKAANRLLSILKEYSSKLL